MANIFSKILDVNAREIDEFHKIVKEINSFDKKYQKLKDSDFPKKTAEFKKRISDAADTEKALKEILPEAFALSREAAWRAIRQKPFDVQLVAGIALFRGRVAEQKTGEGKTLSAVAPLYLRALAGHGAHLVTVNDYLARLGTGWNGPIFDLLGLTIGTIVQENKSFIFDLKYSDKSHGDERLAHLRPVERKEAYNADITYGTNNEYGFDYLRDNMVQTLPEMAQRGHYFGIVDEVDSVLIDEARTPLIISAPDTEPTDKYYKFASLVEKLEPEDYIVDEKVKGVTLTEGGIEKVEKIMGVDNLYEKDFNSIHHIENALRARALYLKDREYVVREGEVVIVDEFTGRLMVGRRWSDGLHQAVEAKEGVTIQQESKTLATISFQNYFRMYEHLSGMTGTASTEAQEFKKIYKLDVVVILTHRPMVRKDLGDVIYKTVQAKYEALVTDIKDRNKEGQPVLVGTTSIEKNEIVATYLKKMKIKHNVLNAKNHEKEASIIAQAGKPGAVTVATNMAGRGVDIILGGAMPDKPAKLSNEKFLKYSAYKNWQKKHDKVVASGGLHEIGTERHESRRIDNQLRGRSGRQGDPGSSRFYLSLEDDLMRIFGGERIGNLMNTLRVPEDQPIENRLISKAIEQSQVKVEGFNFDARKQVVEYDDVSNSQRDIIYKLRKRILETSDLTGEILEKLEHQVDKLMLLLPIKGMISDTSLEEIAVSLADIVPFDDASIKLITYEISKINDRKKIREILIKVISDAHSSREKQVGEGIMRQIEKYGYLTSIDQMWIDHLDHIDDLREGIWLRAHGQRDPVVEFKNEAYSLFEGLIDRIDAELAHRIFRIEIGRTPLSAIPNERLVTNEDRSDNIGLIANKPKEKSKNKIGRNDPFPCGAIDTKTGKVYKYKKCGLINAPWHKG